LWGPWRLSLYSRQCRHRLLKQCLSAPPRGTSGLVEAGDGAITIGYGPVAAGALPLTGVMLITAGTMVVITVGIGTVNRSTDVQGIEALPCQPLR